MESAIWGLIGTVIGALASVGTTWMSSLNSAKLHKQAALDARTERERVFQCETLLDLQEALHDALRQISKGYLEDCASYETHGRTQSWSSLRLSEEVNEGIRLAQRKVAILIERVADDSLRKVVKNLMKIASQTLQANSKAEAEANWIQINSMAFNVLENLGNSLRRHY